MRKDTCLFCHRRACYERVVSTDGGKTYDEVACDDHRADLHKHSDSAVPGVRKHFISSTGKQKRGVVWPHNVKLTGEPLAASPAEPKA